ncbi:hypothetical protein AOLI_G00280000 [Acnodon oligacanthus]
MTGERTAAVADRKTDHVCWVPLRRSQRFQNNKQIILGLPMALWEITKIQILGGYITPGIVDPVQIHFFSTELELL